MASVKRSNEIVSQPLIHISTELGKSNDCIDRYTNSPISDPIVTTDRVAPNIAQLNPAASVFIPRRRPSSAVHERPCPTKGLSNQTASHPVEWDSPVLNEDKHEDDVPLHGVGDELDSLVDKAAKAFSEAPDWETFFESQ